MRRNSTAHEWRDRPQGWSDTTPDRDDDWLDECFSKWSRQKHSQAALQFAELPDARLVDVAREIENSRAMLLREPDWDDDGAEKIADRTWRTAVDFLRGHAIAVLNSTGHAIPAPRILPLPDGSIDLHWKSGSNELLVNFPPAEGVSAKFYGDNAGGTIIRGELDPESQNSGLLLWLTSL